MAPPRWKGVPPNIQLQVQVLRVYDEADILATLKSGCEARGRVIFITINLVYEYVLRQQTKQIIPREGASGPPQKGNQQLRNKERNPATATESSAPESIGVLVRPIRHTAQMSTDTRFLLLQVKTLPSTNTLKPKHSSLRILVRRRKVYGVQGVHGYLLGST